MQANDSWGFAFLEVAEDGFADVGAELLPSVGLGDDGVAKSAGNEAAVGIVLGDLKYDFAHEFSLAEGEVLGKLVMVYG